MVYPENLGYSAEITFESAGAMEFEGGPISKMAPGFFLEAKCNSKPGRK